MRAAARFVTAAALALALCAACASIPAGKTAADWLAVLPADSSYYLCLNTKSSRDLVKNVLRKTPINSPDIEQLVDFTDWAYCGVKVRPGVKPSFAIITLGNYPFVIRSVFDGSAEMKTLQKDPPLWLYKKSKLEIALPQNYMVAVATENAAGLVTAAQSPVALSGVSPAAAREIAGNDLTLYFPLGWDDLVAGETGLTLPRKIFNEIWLGARLRDGRYYFSGVFNLGTDADPQSFKKLLQFFLLALLRRNEVEGVGKRLADMKYSVEERMIKVSDFYLTAQELEPLIAGVIGKGL
jgi:hypothetical protein